MDKIVIILVVVAVIIVFAYFIVAKLSGEEQGIQDEANKIGIGVKEPYTHCVRDSNCIGGTNVMAIGNTAKCSDGLCVPMVKEDGIGNIMFAPTELGLPKISGRYYLLGEGIGPCARNSQCDAAGTFRDAGDPQAVSATGHSRYYCDIPRTGTCRAKGMWGGIYIADPPPGATFPENQRSANISKLAKLAGVKLDLNKGIVVSYDNDDFYKYWEYSGKHDR